MFHDILEVGFTDAGTLVRIPWAGVVVLLEDEHAQRDEGSQVLLEAEEDKGEGFRCPYLSSEYRAITENW